MAGKSCIARVALAILLARIGPVQAVPLMPDATLGGIPAAQALATMQILGEWRLLSGGQIRLAQALSRNGAECGVSDRDDADTCGRFTLFIAVNGETAVPVDFTLFRLPETLGWQLPKDAKPASDYGKFSIPLAACEMRKTLKGTGWMERSYLLYVTQDLKPDGHYGFAADLERLPGERIGCPA